MAFLKMLPEFATLPEALEAQPGVFDTRGPLAQAIMRRPGSELTAAERELLFAYSSALPGCTHCATAHYPVAEALGIELRRCPD